MLIKKINILTNDIHPFSVILQEGVGVKVKSGCTLTQFLRNICGISNDYIEKRVKTAFINQKPVDNYDTAIIHDQDMIGLSGAMPGLVGATFRKNSVLSPFRSNISYAGIKYDEPVSENRDGMIILRLFNILIKEIGPRLLEKGVLIQEESLVKILEAECLENDCFVETVMLDGKKSKWESNNHHLCYTQIKKTRYL